MVILRSNKVFNQNIYNFKFSNKYCIIKVSNSIDRGFITGGSKQQNISEMVKINGHERSYCDNNVVLVMVQASSSSHSLHLPFSLVPFSRAPPLPFCTSR